MISSNCRNRLKELIEDAVKKKNALDNHKEKHMVKLFPKGHFLAKSRESRAPEEQKEIDFEAW